MDRLFKGKSDSERFVSLNLVVLFRIDLILNLFVDADGFSPSLQGSSLNFAVLPCIVFLNSPKTSFLCFSNFFVLLSSGSTNPFFVAHFFSKPCNLLI